MNDERLNDKTEEVGVLGPMTVRGQEVTTGNREAFCAFLENKKGVLEDRDKRKRQKKIPEIDSNSVFAHTVDRCRELFGFAWLEPGSFLKPNQFLALKIFGHYWGSQTMDEEEIPIELRGMERMRNRGSRERLVEESVFIAWVEENCETEVSLEPCHFLPTTNEGLDFFDEAKKWVEEMREKQERERDSLGLLEIALLSEEEEKMLSWCVLQGNWVQENVMAEKQSEGERERLSLAGRAKNLFLMANLRLVRSQIKRISNFWEISGVTISKEDIEGAGRVCLLERVIPTFDWRRGWRFSTYAGVSLRREMYEAGYREAFQIRRPSRVEKGMEKEDETGPRVTFSLDQERFDEGDLEEGEVTSDPGGVWGVEDEVLWRDFVEQIRSTLKKDKKSKRRVDLLDLLLSGETETNNVEMAEMMGVSKEAVRKLRISLTESLVS